jgi:hypothetical protein
MKVPGSAADTLERNIDYHPIEMVSIFIGDCRHDVTVSEALAIASRITIAVGVTLDGRGKGCQEDKRRFG